MICPKCKARYLRSENPSGCPVCASHDRQLWDMLSGIVVMGCIALIVVILGLTCQGCSAKNARSVLVTGSAGVTAAVKIVKTGALCDIVEARCKTNPCAALDKCHKAELMAVQAGRAFIQSARALNEVIP